MPTFTPTISTMQNASLQPTLSPIDNPTASKVLSPSNDESVVGSNLMIIFIFFIVTVIFCMGGPCIYDVCNDLEKKKKTKKGTTVFHKQDDSLKEARKSLDESI